MKILSFRWNFHHWRHWKMLILTTSTAASDVNFIKMEIFTVQCYQLDTLEKTEMKFWLKYKCIWKRCLPNDGHFVKTSFCKLIGFEFAPNRNHWFCLAHCFADNCRAGQLPKELFFHSISHQIYSWFCYNHTPCQRIEGDILVSLCPSVCLPICLSIHSSVCSPNCVQSVSSTILARSSLYSQILSADFRKCVTCCILFFKFSNLNFCWIVLLNDLAYHVLAFSACEIYEDLS